MPLLRSNPWGWLSPPYRPHQPPCIGRPWAAPAPRRRPQTHTAMSGTDDPRCDPVSGSTSGPPPRLPAPPPPASQLSSAVFPPLNTL
jgi:hypothetical protein